MTRTPAEALFDSACKCGKPGGCACWVTLRCRTCHLTRTVERRREDGSVKEIPATCPACVEAERRPSARRNS
jgi:hypothetical protein